MADQSQQRVVMVTGAATGIGAGIARRFVDGGARVVIADIDGDRAATYATELGAQTSSVQLDVSSLESWETAIAEVEEREGALHVLVNCAGINPFGDVLALPIADWRRTFSVNLDGVFFGCRTAIPLIARSGGGALVNIGSPTGEKANAALPAYGASKAAILNLSKSIALTCAERKLGIRCNVVIPGAVHTEMTERYLRSMPDYEKTLQGISESRPLKRLGTPADIAEAVFFLASDQASFITGQSLAVDGGALLI